MTIASQINRNQYVGNGLQMNFPYTFRILNASDLKVVKRVNNTETVQIPGVDYTVSDVGSSGGLVQFTYIPSSGSIITIVRNQQILQPETYVENDSFPAASHERALDRVTTAAQTNAEQLNRSLKVAVSTNMSTFSADLPLITSEDMNKLIAIKEDLTGFEFVEGDGSAPGGTVNGPLSSTNNAVVIWDGITGDLVKDSTVIVENNGSLSIRANSNPGINLFSNLNNTTSELRFYQLQSFGVNYTGFRAPNLLSSSIIYRLPPSDGDPGQVLATDGFGNLFWTDNVSPTPPPDSLAGLSDVDLTGLASGDILYTPDASLWINISAGESGSYQPFSNDISVTDLSETREENIDMDGNKVDQVVLEAYSETTHIITTTINVADGNVARLTHNSDISLTFISSLFGGHSAFTLIRTKDGSGTPRFITWPGTVVWELGSPPTLTQTSGAVDVFYFRTINNGTTWFGFINSNLA